MGCVTQVGEQALNVGRVALLVAGWPETVTATTVDRQCGSSMQAAFNAAAAVGAGHLDVVVAAGVEHMTRVPMGSNMGAEGWGVLNEKIGERWPIVPQGISAEVIAEEWGLTREQLDAYSLESHRRAVAAIDEGRFEREIVPVEVGAAGAAVLFAVDETPRRETSLESARRARPRLQAGRRRHRRQLELDRRRCRCDARHERRGGRTARSRAPRALRLVRARRASTRTACCTATRRRAIARSRGPGSRGTTSR